ncbi:MAG: hypothetical protein KGI11_10010 [Thaumarchaeota archaeon]|nr:hypothetical protein [Nitrososphaerota archaeon]
MQASRVMISILTILIVASSILYFGTDNHAAYARSSYHYKITTHQHQTNYEKIMPELKIKNR